MKFKYNRKLLFIIPPLITVVWLLVIYFTKGIFPFGSGTIIDYDLYQAGIPGLYNVYDAFHSGTLFYDFTTAGGFGRDALMSLFVPDNLFILFFKRDMIINAVSLLLIIKLAVISFTSSYSFSKLFPDIPFAWVTVLSLIYTFCGYNIQYYTNLQWLDTVALYPLLILFTLNLFNGKSKIPYFIVLSYLLVFNTYMSFFVVISLIVFGGLYIFIVENKFERLSDIYSLGVATIASLVVSCFSLYKYFTEVFGTARFDMGALTSQSDAAQSTNPRALFKILEASNNLEISSVFMLLGLEFAVVCLIILWCHYKNYRETRKYTLFFTFTFIALLLQIFFKGVNLLWHGGSYVCFPFRNGYMLSFFACLIIGYYVSEFDMKYDSKYKINILNLLIPILCAFSFFVIAPYLITFFKSLSKFNVLTDNNAFNTHVLLFPWGMAALLVVAGLFLFRLIRNKNVRMVMTCVLIIATIGTVSFRIIGNSQDSERAGLYNQYYKDCADVSENIKNNDAFERVCNPDLSLITNYPYISGVPSISNWTHTLSGNQINSFVKLGFSSVYTRTLDSGGTVFSKSLLHITDTVSKTELSNKLYSKNIKTENGMNFYNNKFTIPVGVLMDKTVEDIHYSDYANTFQYQNAIYSSMTRENDLFTWLSPETINEEYTVEGDKELGIEMNQVDVCNLNTSINVDSDSVLYFMLDKSLNPKCYIKEITVNGKTVNIPTFSDNKYNADNTFYPAGFNNNLIELGTFGNENVEIDYKIVNGNADNIILYSMNLGKMQKLCDSTKENRYKIGKASVSLNVKSNSDGKIAFIPLSYDKNWKCTVNGVKTEPICVVNNFIGVQVNNGENDIVLKYSPRSVYINVVFVTVCFLLALAFLIFENKAKSVPSWIKNVMGAVFVLIFGVAVMVIYSVPVIYVLVTKLINVFMI